MAQRKRQSPKRGKPPKLRIVGGSSKRESPPTPQEKKYFADLHLIVDKIFEEAANEFDWTWNQLAFHADVGYHTVSNLGERVTQFPRFSTVYKLAKAVGWSLITQADMGKKSSGATGKVKIYG